MKTSSKTPSKTIYDYEGGKLRLERGRLIAPCPLSIANNWMASFAEIRKAYRATTGKIRILETNRVTGKKTGRALFVDFFVSRYRNRGMSVIGCRKFDMRTINQILKAAGVKATPATKAMTAYKKALAAKAGR